MADESDVDAAIVDVIDAAIYPRGPRLPSAIGIQCKVYPGWPVSAALEADLKDSVTNISVFAVPSSASDTGQPFLTEDAVITPAVHGLAASVVGPTITFTGAPGPDEYATAVIGGTGYTYLTQTGDSAAQVALGLAAELSAAFPGTTATGAAVRVATNRDVILRLGAPAVMGTRIHRQRQQFRVVIWSPSPEDRTKVARFVDVALKRNLTLRLPDTTMALLTYQGTNPADTYELNGLYRRDLIYNATYDTLDTYQVFEVTSVGVDLNENQGAFERLPIISL